MAQHVIDTNVLIHGSGLELPFEQMITVPEATQELKTPPAQQRFEAEDIQIQEPSPENIEKIRQTAEKRGEDLSDTDTKLLALALQLNAVLVTDDYGMQNLAEALDIDYTGFLKKEIENPQEWEKICSRCGKKLEGDICSVCGGRATKNWR